MAKVSSSSDLLPERSDKIAENSFARTGPPKLSNIYAVNLFSKESVPSILFIPILNTAPLPNRLPNKLLNRSPNDSKQESSKTICSLPSPGKLSRFILMRKSTSNQYQGITLPFGNFQSKVSLDWTGTYLGEIQTLDLRDQFSDVGGNSYWTLRVNQQEYTCLFRRITSIDPLFIDEMKKFFGLPNMGTHYLKYQRKYYLLIRPHQIEGVQTYDPKSNKYAVEGRRFRKLMQYTIIFRYIFGLSQNFESSIRIRDSANKTNQTVQGIYGCGYHPFTPYQEPFDTVYPISGIEGRLFYCRLENMEKNCVPNRIWEKWFIKFGETLEEVAGQFLGCDRMNGSLMMKVLDMIEKTFARIDPERRFMKLPRYYAENITDRLNILISSIPRKSTELGVVSRESSEFIGPIEKIASSGHYNRIYREYLQQQRYVVESLLFSELERAKRRELEQIDKGSPVSQSILLNPPDPRSVPTVPLVAMPEITSIFSIDSSRKPSPTEPKAEVLPNLILDRTADIILTEWQKDYLQKRLMFPNLPVSYFTEPSIDRNLGDIPKDGDFDLHKDHSFNSGAHDQMGLIEKIRNTDTGLIMIKPVDSGTVLQISGINPLILPNKRDGPVEIQPTDLITSVTSPSPVVSTMTKIKSIPISTTIPTEGTIYSRSSSRNPIEPVFQMIPISENLFDQFK